MRVIWGLILGFECVHIGLGAGRGGGRNGMHRFSSFVFKLLCLRVVEPRLPSGLGHLFAFEHKDPEVTGGVLRP